jgi:formylglycine-generating enzyme required for sulfatase activity
VLVSWPDAAAYCEWVGGRLPTEAEWEYAARGPETPVYPWGDPFDGTLLNFCDSNCPFDHADAAVDDGYEFTAPVGAYPSGDSWIGALDMAGNVWEWVNDWYVTGYYAVSEASNPQGPETGEFKLLRGGAWDSFANDTRSAYRINDVPNARYYHVGFRCAWDRDTSSASAGVTAAPTADIPPTSAPIPTATAYPVEIRTVTRGGVEVEQVFVPAGSFLMGSWYRELDQRPVHDVTLDAFWLDRTEVTNAEFGAFISSTGYETTAEINGTGGAYLETANAWNYIEGAEWRRPHGPDSNIDGLDAHPVVQVSWYDAMAFCEWVEGRLPTEAEWEFAARGPESMLNPWGDIFEGERVNACDRNCFLDSRDSTTDDGYEFTAPVGMYLNGASWIGALDMAGNVSEWINDWYDSGYYGRSPEENPSGPDTGETKVLRGGGWTFIEEFMRSAHRQHSQPEHRSDRVGFRCAQD